MAYGISRHAEVKIRNQSKEANNSKMEKAKIQRGKHIQGRKQKGKTPKSGSQWEQRKHVSTQRDTTNWQSKWSAHRLKYLRKVKLMRHR